VINNLQIHDIKNRGRTSSNKTIYEMRSFEMYKISKSPYSVYHMYTYTAHILGYDFTYLRFRRAYKNSTHTVTNVTNLGDRQLITFVIICVQTSFAEIERTRYPYVHMTSFDTSRFLFKSMAIKCARRRDVAKRKCSINISINMQVDINMTENA
jgi:hypothetical protein